MIDLFDLRDGQAIAVIQKCLQVGLIKLDGMFRKLRSSAVGDKGIDRN